MRLRLKRFLDFLETSPSAPRGLLASLDADTCRWVRSARYPEARERGQGGVQSEKEAGEPLRSTHGVLLCLARALPRESRQKVQRVQWAGSLKLYRVKCFWKNMRRTKLCESALLLHTHGSQQPLTPAVTFVTDSGLSPPPPACALNRLGPYNWTASHRSPGTFQRRCCLHGFLGCGKFARWEMDFLGRWMVTRTVTDSSRQTR